MKDNLIYFFGFVGALDTLIVPLIFSQGQEPLFPLPGLYLIEIGLVGLLALASIFARRWPLVPWLAGGILLAFVVLGAWTIGFFLVPGFLAFSAAAALWQGPPAASLLRPAGILVLAAFIQASGMLLAVQLL